MKRNALHSDRPASSPGTPARDQRQPIVGTLARDVRRAIAWSSLSNLVLRVSSLAVGIVLARLLSPEEFGIYAVALTVQTILMTIADLGLSADLIRSENPERKAPTVATLGITVGVLLTAGMMVTCQALADSLGSPDAAGTIAVLAITLVLGGAGVVPYAMLQRRFAQKQLFAISVADFVVGTSITIGLVLLGWGVIGLAIGRVVAQSLTLLLQFVFARVRPKFGFDRSLVRQVLAFGLPIAGANLISWALLNVDNVVISRIAGPTALGFYVLAFNISSWPMSAIGQVVRSISLPLFARSVGKNKHTVLADTTALAWAATLPAGAFLALLSAPIIVVVYGPKWLPAAQVLAALGMFGALRALFDLFAAYLLARGASRSVLWTQVIWVAALVPALIAATGWLGIVGAGWVHLAVAVVFVLPAYLIALHRTGIELAGLARACWPPIAAMIPASAAVLLVSTQSDAALWQFLLGGLSGGAVYLALIYRWATRRIRAANSVQTTGSHREQSSVKEEQS
ncbi:oligosaccharide flippase family protein [Parafrigoribacterium mesophilum]|uniref:lipopolysaccharide biosynthesis protein n=1 Tax=Parafrigoribacterium mesophilum TaxID=433646 RepID=UPI0031FE2328